MSRVPEFLLPSPSALSLLPVPSAYCLIPVFPCLVPSSDSSHVLRLVPLLRAYPQCLVPCPKAVFLLPSSFYLFPVLCALPHCLVPCPNTLSLVPSTVSLLPCETKKSSPLFFTISPDPYSSIEKISSNNPRAACKSQSKPKPTTKQALRSVGDANLFARKTHAYFEYS